MAVTLIRNLEEKDSYSQTREQVCFENTKMAQLVENHLSAQNNAFTNRLDDDSQRNKVW